MKTAALLLVGNELLTGKIQDANLAFLAKELFALGIRLQRCVVCVDDVEVIAADVRTLRAAHDIVFTSGGVGPTHDDVTIEGVACAFGRAVVRSPEVEGLIRVHFGEACTPEHLRMAEMPEGAEMVRGGPRSWPTICVDEVYVLPGVPEILQIKFASLRERLRQPAALYSKAAYLTAEEGAIARLIANVASLFSDVAVGSYINWSGQGYRVKVTFDGQNPARLDAAMDLLIAGVPASEVVSID